MDLSIETRVHKLESGEEIKQREYYFDDGCSVWAPEKSCCFCKNCTDIWYDYTNGPYMFHCVKAEESEDEEDTLTPLGYEGKCGYFEFDEEGEKSQIEIKKSMMYARDPETIKSIIGEEKYNELIEAIKKCVDDEMKRMGEFLTDAPEPVTKE